MNKVILMGRLTKEPDVRLSQDGKTTIARFSIAVDRRHKSEGQPEADFFNCTMFGKLAEFGEKYLSKGTKVVLSGSLQNDSYTDKDGNKRTATQIIVSEIEFAESKKNDQAPASNAGFMSIPDNVVEELPFN